jgi:L-fuconolactonase
MVTEADHQKWQFGDFRPYLDVVFETFRPDRLMFGSDWPVCLLGGSYEQIEGLARDYVRHLGPKHAADFWGENCARFYLNNGRRPDLT